MEAKVRLTDIATLIKVGHDESERRLADLRSDFDQKHKENVDRRHTLLNKIEEIENRVHTLDGRVKTMEAHMVSIIGDNSGGSGLLHKMDKALDSLKEEVASIKQTVQNTPAINRWIYAAMGIVAFLVVVIPSAIFVLFEVLKLIMKH